MATAASEPKAPGWLSRRLTLVRRGTTLVLDRAMSVVSRRKIQIGALLAGAGSGIGTLTSGDHITGSIVLLSVVVCALTGAPILLIDGTIRARLSSVSVGESKPETGRPAKARVDQSASAVASTAQERDGTFRGRTVELAELVALHDRERQARTSGAESRPAASGPVQLLIHGKPGVGKSRLAGELADRLAGQYPGGLLRANFGIGGEPKPPAEILKQFVVQLGRPEAEIPHEATERANLLRSMTAGKQILFLFDAARHHDQVLQVLPTEPGCAVIVTSRRDLAAQLNAPPSRPPLDVPPIEEALEMFTAYSGIDWTAQAEQAIEVIEVCGRLPMAIRAAADRVSQDGTDLRHVADLLRSPKTRLDWLVRGGHGVNERIQSEYNRLLPRQQRALCLLTLVESPTFVPWVLRALLDVRQYEAENIMASLAAAQLLDNAGVDKATGVARYRFNPLIRLFAKAQLVEHDDVEAAQERLDLAYLRLVDDVLAELRSGYERIFPRVDHRPGPTAAQRIVEHPEDSIRAEYHNLLRVITVARSKGHLELCWRVAALVRGCVPTLPGTIDSLEAFGHGVSAAREDANVLGEMDVSLAKASFLVAVEDYPEAFSILSKVIENSDHLSSPPPDGSARTVLGRGLAVRKARAQRKMAEAFQQMGAYGRASDLLEEAALTADHAGTEEERRLVQLLRAENHRVPSPQPTYADILEGHLQDPVYFRALLGRSEENRRRAQWGNAEQDLLDVEQRCVGDARRTAAVQYRLARLYIDRWRRGAKNLGVPIPPVIQDGTEPDDDPAAGTTVDSEAGADRDELAAKAVRRAAEAALSSHRMNNAVGIVRAQCQQVRALVVAGQLLAAEQLLHDIWQSLNGPALVESPARTTLLARFSRAHGELLLHRGDIDGAWRALRKAASRYRMNQDWACYAEVWQLLDVLQRNYPYPKSNGHDEMETVEDPNGVRLPWKAPARS
ncbi:NB-ARC domain-containing protein [Catellatospora tritici]|uniref:NB-ARC domain-containing protein n=1 Tax=Catellatospora tritici TaxID=2851566 RepID=UPI001C2D05F7|nr:NB-ARC domain-containing protein [Catellatospora tritici]MBV1856511.1 hypothetical protein [Catellatospora tritici]